MTLPYVAPPITPLIFTTPADNAPVGAAKLDNGLALLNNLANGTTWFLAPSGDVTGATDSAALQSVINTFGFTSPPGGSVLLANGKFYLNATLTIPATTDWSFFGSSRGTILNMVTDNTPIFTFTGALTNAWAMGSFTLQWTNNQPATNTLAIGFYFNAGAGNSIFNWRVTDFTFINGFRAFSTTATSTTLVWGVLIDNFSVPASPGMSGSFYWSNNAAAGQPHIRIRDGNINCISPATEPVIAINNADNVLLDNIELLGGSYAAGIPQITISTSTYVTLLNVKSEVASIAGGAGAGPALWSFSNSNVVAIGVKALALTITGSGVFATFIAIPTAPTFGQLSVIGIAAQGLGAGNVLYAMAVFGTGPPRIMTVENINLAGTAALYSAGTTGPRLLVDALTPNATQVKGDVNYTALVTDPRVILYNATLTANRTVTLPTAGLQDGQEFYICRKTATPGAFTLTSTDPTSGFSEVIASGSNGFMHWRCNGTSWFPFAGGTFT